MTDMYKGPDLHPGSRVAVSIGGKLYAQTVDGWSYKSSTPEIVRRLTWWQRTIRAVTPKRYRKSLVIRESQPSMMEMRLMPEVDLDKQNHPPTCCQNPPDWWSAMMMQSAECGECEYCEGGR